jgi:MtN3 and saliva related transmembrane protein
MFLVIYIDISLITFVGFILTQLAAILYGYFHKDYILMVGYMLAILTCGAVTALAFKYRNKQT